MDASAVLAANVFDGSGATCLGRGLANAFFSNSCFGVNGSKAEGHKVSQTCSCIWTEAAHALG